MVNLNGRHGLRFTSRLRSLGPRAAELRAACRYPFMPYPRRDAPERGELTKMATKKTTLELSADEVDQLDELIECALRNEVYEGRSTDAKQSLLLIRARLRRSLKPSQGESPFPPPR